MCKPTREQINEIRSKICNGETGLIATLTPDIFFAMLRQERDDGFYTGKESIKKEFICLLAASGICEDEIAIILNIEEAFMRNIVAMKKGHIEKCIQRLERRRKRKL